MYTACLPYQAVTWGKEATVCFLSQFLLPKTLGNCLFDRVFCPIPFLLGIKAQHTNQGHRLVHKHLVSGEGRVLGVCLKDPTAVMKEKTSATPTRRAANMPLSIPDFCFVLVSVSKALDGLCGMFKLSRVKTM